MNKTPEIFASNKRVQHNFRVVERLQAGIELKGWEAKAIRSRTFSFGDSYCRFFGGELYLVQMSIGPYPFAHTSDDELKRRRRLLLHRRELAKLSPLVAQQGLTIVPASLSFSEKGRVKVDLVVGKFLGERGSKEASERRRLDREMRGYLR